MMEDVQEFVYYPSTVLPQSTLFSSFELLMEVHV
jgi:hypothetical protein